MHSNDTPTTRVEGRVLNDKKYEEVDKMRGKKENSQIQSHDDLLLRSII